MSDDLTVLDDSSPEDPTSRPATAEGPKEFGHYRLLRELGRGAQGVVFLAEDQRLHRKVALKMLTAASVQSESVRERFHREAEVASKLDHPGICGVHEMGEVEGIPYIAMQYVRGTTLADAIAATRTVPGTEPRDVPDTSIDLADRT